MRRDRYEGDPFEAWRRKQPVRLDARDLPSDEEVRRRNEIADGIMAGRIRIIGEKGAIVGSPQLFPLILLDSSRGRE